jgi:hypothetical protein
VPSPTLCVSLLFTPHMPVFSGSFSGDTPHGSFPPWVHCLIYHSLVEWLFNNVLGKVDTERCVYVCVCVCVCTLHVYVILSEYISHIWYRKHKDKTRLLLSCFLM